MGVCIHLFIIMSIISLIVFFVKRFLTSTDANTPTFGLLYLRISMNLCVDLKVKKKIKNKENNQTKEKKIMNWVGVIEVV